MRSAPLSPELCARIVHWASSSARRRDLLALCLTCKAFQREVEAQIYSSIVLSDAHRALLACSMLATTPRLAHLVRTFYFNYEPRRGPALPILGLPLWHAVQGALEAMIGLEILCLGDPAFANSWVFDSERIRFQLYEAKLRFAWDAHLVKFLESQRRLQTLQFFDRMEDVVGVEISQGAMPSLKSFDGTLMIGLQLFAGCPLSHVQMCIDTEIEATPGMLPRLASLAKTLRGLSLLEMPEELSVKSLDVISRVCPLLRHLGLFPLPLHNRHKFYSSLMRLHYVRSIELDLLRWSPHPSPGAQRALAAEVKMYCPTVRTIIFWVGSTRFRWSYHNDEWHSRAELHQYPQHGTLWYNA